MSRPLKFCRRWSFLDVMRSMARMTLGVWWVWAMMVGCGTDETAADGVDGAVTMQDGAGPRVDADDSEDAGAVQLDGEVEADGSRADGGADADLPARCSALGAGSPAEQVALVEADLTCMQSFVDAFIADPARYLEAFYDLVASTTASDALFSVVYEELRLGRFRFDAVIAADLAANLADAVPECPTTYRCTDWHVWIVDRILSGEAFRCPPTFVGMSAAELLAAVPFGDYYCTESLATALGDVANTTIVDALLEDAASLESAWGRRNALRILGRMAERPMGDAARTLVRETRQSEVRRVAIERLELESSLDVLNDAIWLIDAQLYPVFEAQPALEGIAGNTALDTTSRFRAIAAISRLMQAKTGLVSTSDRDFIVASLSSDDVWVRAQAAYTLQVLDGSRFDAALETAFVSALTVAYGRETQLTAQIYMARALDRFRGTDLAGELKAEFEGTHLPNTLSADGLTIRSGLPSSELAAFLEMMRDEREAFFDILGVDFTSPVAEDSNDSMTLLVFATRDLYVQYMDGFVGFGSAAGGLYLEGIATLYTFEREPHESVYTVEELIKHEFGHYLQGRYVYLGLWGSSGYFTEPKGWADEGFAEVLGGLSFASDGSYTVNRRASHVASICASPFRSLESLLSQRAGYDQAGVFDYSNGWSLAYHMFTSRRSDARNLYRTFRDDTYALANFATLIGAPSVAALEMQWHTAMSSWCASAAGPAGPSGDADSPSIAAIRPLMPDSVCSTVERHPVAVSDVPVVFSRMPAP